MVRSNGVARATGWGTDIGTGMLAGLVASAVTAGSDKLFSSWIGWRARVRERRVRRGSPHDLAGPFFARKLLGRRLKRDEREQASLIFAASYGVVWGAVYAVVRRQVPAVQRFGGLGFAVPFYLACDGLIAPAVGLGVGLQRIPWQYNAKELANHAVWTATAEGVHRGVEAAVAKARAAQEERRLRAERPHSPVYG